VAEAVDRADVAFSFGVAIYSLLGLTVAPVIFVPVNDLKDDTKIAIYFLAINFSKLKQNFGHTDNIFEIIYFYFK